MTKILVIDDEQGIREKILNILEYEGFESLSAENGRIGVEVARKQLPDLILCDVMMPELGGYGVLTQLRTEPLTSTIPFIFLTGKSAPEEVRQGMTLGADDYLVKPFKASDLLTAIHTRLEKHAEASKQMEDLRLSLSKALPHELKTPLNSIIGFTEYIINFGPQLELDFDEILEMQRSIYSCAIKLQRLIENYLLYAKLQLMMTDSEQREIWRSKGQITVTKNLIAHWIEHEAERLRRQKDIVCNLSDASFDMPGEHLQKIVYELLDNACKFSEKETVIHIVTVVEEKHFILTIVDQGSGMTKEQIAHVGSYMQFERGHYEQQGAGLGLTIARILTQLHGGEFTIESKPNEGTTVIVKLPRK